ncbi:hypothetical protein [Epilithonimonas xixisoli]|nr:hypothetical protein [Epilithonimonas xixisoli]
MDNSFEIIKERRSCFDDKLLMIQEDFKVFFENRKILDYIVTTHTATGIGLFKIDEEIPLEIKNKIENAFNECYKK